MMVGFEGWLGELTGRAGYEGLCMVLVRRLGQECSLGGLIWRVRRVGWEKWQRGLVRRVAPASWLAKSIRRFK